MKKTQRDGHFSLFFHYHKTDEFVLSPTKLTNSKERRIQSAMYK